MSRPPSPMLTGAAAAFVVLSGAVFVFLTRIVAGIVADGKEHPHADGFGMLAGVVWIVLLGWIPLVTLVLWTLWRNRLRPGPSGRPALLIGRTGWTVVRVLAVVAGLLLLFQLVADRSALSPTPVAIFQCLAFVAWTVTAVEVLIRGHSAAASPSR